MNPGLWRMIFRTSCVRNIRFPSIKMGEDLVFIAALNLPGLSVAFDERINYSYYSGLGYQLTSQSNLNSLAALQELRTRSSEIEIGRFFSIVYTQLLLSAIVRIQSMWSLKELAVSVKFLKELKSSAVIFTLAKRIVKGKML